MKKIIFYQNWRTWIFQRIPNNDKILGIMINNDKLPISIRFLSGKDEFTFVVFLDIKNVQNSSLETSIKFIGSLLKSSKLKFIDPTDGMSSLFINPEVKKDSAMYVKYNRIIFC